MQTEYEIQLELPLAPILDPDGLDPNRKNILTKIIAERYLGSGQSWKIYNTRNFKKNETNYWLGIRTFVYDVDHEYIEKINYSEAIWLTKNFNVTAFMTDLGKDKTND